MSSSTPQGEAATWVYAIDDPTPADGRDPAVLLGGKGAGLKQLRRHGLPVPPCFTITTACCKRYFELERAWPDDLEAQVRGHVARLERETGRAFGRGAAPLLVSVRSGAAVSMPGMMDTLLDCGLHPGLAADVGDVPAFWRAWLRFAASFARTVHGLDAAELVSGSEDDESFGRDAAERWLERYRERTGREFPIDPWSALVACIDAVFDSWHGERAVAYRARHGIRDLDGTAVNVQAMVAAESSGVAFTRDPTRSASEFMVIESSWGLGESVVSGDVTPDRFTVRRDDPTEVRIEPGRKAGMVTAFGRDADCDPDAPSLTQEQATRLGELALRVETCVGHPADIEWALADGEFTLLQWRQIGGLDVAADVERGRRDEIERLRAVAAGEHRVWVAHNLGETLPAPTPLTWDIVGQFMTGAGGFGRLYVDLGYRPSAEVCERGFLELICGRIYADPERLAGLFWDGMPLRYDRDLLDADRSQLDRAPTLFDPDRADGRFLLRLPANLWGMWRVARRMSRRRVDAKRRFEAEVLPPYLDWIDAKRAEDLSQRTDSEMLDELDARVAKVLDEFGPRSLEVGFLGAFAFERLRALLVQLAGQDEGERQAALLTSALDGDTTLEQDAMLVDVAEGCANLDEFVARYGHRCAGEMELAEPRWREDRAVLERMLESLRARDAEKMSRLRAARDERLGRRRKAEARLPRRLAEWGASSLRERVEACLAEARELLPYRERGKHFLLMGYELIRQALEELARRWSLGRDIYFLRRSELRELVRRRDELCEEIARRRVRWCALGRLDLPDVIDSRELDGLGIPGSIEAWRELAGVAVAPGIARGPAAIVTDPAAAGELGTGYVLVCPSTDPGWTVLFLGASALVVERGGMLSHGAIVARDHGIPAVVCPDATRRFKSGEQLRVDGDRGRVSVLDGGSDDARAME